jgi:predicted dehydrogenase
MKDSNIKNRLKQIDRRDFIKTSTLLASAVAVPGALATSCEEKKPWPEGKLNVACIGLKMGFGNLMRCDTENIVALCDADERPLKNRLKEYKEKYPDRIEPYTFQDYRKMMQKIGDQIDAVIIATPDHTHANITLDLMKMGKHVYTQKPLTHNVYESRILTQAAKKYPVATQMGNQGASNEDTARICESIWDDAIGEIKEVYAWTNRPIWPQALNRPEESFDVPDYLDWDLWIGPAEYRPYHPAYHPWNWRGRWDFGTGALGDMACHILDVVMRSLRLQYPSGIEASTTKWTMDSPSEAEKITFHFPKRAKYKKVNMPEVKVTWYDGGMMPDRPAELEPGEKMGDNDGGVLFVGTKGKIMCGCYARNPIMLPREKFADYQPVINERIVEGGIGGHEQDWLRACKENASNRVQTKSHFGFSGPFNEVVVMGTVASRLAGLNRILEWDGENMQFTNIDPEEKLVLPKTVSLDVINDVPRYNTERIEVNALEYANSLIKRPRREGWELEV